ncbi:hypothetical protein [Inhella gelatinilytica]|uniref:Uncharacterized protein n=1 Tax=Inhella gelatinilytica TaxID=2795030 RepID=A0A931N9L0_9BURK|nr:hypothetical protein [Inhella gelatinilytica]MBH9551478.1 hypothetical protein [Inhella gelatinilytica]
MNTTPSRIASLLTFTTMVGLSFASAAALATFQPALDGVSETVVMLPRVEITAKRPEVPHLPTVVVTVKRASTDAAQLAKAEACAPSTAVC